MRWIIDGNNVMGSRPDRWWNDRPGAMARLTQEIAKWCWTHDDSVLVVFDGKSIDEVVQLSGGNLEVRFAERAARDAADDVIVAETTDQPPPLIIVTADKGLRGRLPDTADCEGPSSFLARLVGGP
ncbi:MAG: NYN domain-containing protein [Acidimicrobiia bacterium]